MTGRPNNGETGNVCPVECPTREDLVRLLALAHAAALQGGYGPGDEDDRDRVRVALEATHIGRERLL